MLRLRGAWREAEAEARLAAEALRPSSPVNYGWALEEIAELRRRLGDIDAAWELVQQAVAAGDWPEPVVSLLVWDREGPEPAFYRLDKALRAPRRSRFWRAGLIPAFTEVAIACGKGALAEEHVAELEALADVGQTNVMRGYATGTRGRLRMASGDLDGARSSFESALRAWSAAGVPFEGARDRLALASVLSTRGDRVGAETEAREALRVLEDLGAAPEALRARALLSSLTRTQAEPLRRTTLMFTDVVASTRLAETLGDEAWRDLSAWLDGTMRAAFVAHTGTEIDHAGDGFFVSFESPAGAIDCAVDVQQRLASHRRDHGYAPQVRIGIHCGRVAMNKGALRGVAVNRAARICALADGGQIIASSEAADAAGRERTRSWKAELRGVRGPVEVCEIGWQPDLAAASG
jgi:class 3 adenylate cyclase